MIVGERLRAIRESKGMSQGDMEEKTGLLRCYTSRVENGHTIPSVETLEKMARAMGVQLYQIFFDSEDAKPEEVQLPKPASMNLSSKDAKLVLRLGRLITRMDGRDKKLLVEMARKLVAR